MNPSFAGFEPERSQRIRGYRFVKLAGHGAGVALVCRKVRS